MRLSTYYYARYYRLFESMSPQTIHLVVAAIELYMNQWLKENESK